MRYSEQADKEAKRAVRQAMCEHEWVDSVTLKCPPVKERICTRCGKRERREWP